MSEVYPSDDDLIALLSEAETGVEYIPTGTVPYFLHFRKLISRLLLATKRANDLRLYDEGGLLVGVKAGKFWVGQVLIEYAGSSGNSLADNKPYIYLYLDADGVLVLDEYIGFPDMGVSKHVRLAVITTLGGDIVSIADARDQHSISLPDGNLVGVGNHTADQFLPVALSGSVHTNKGADGNVELSLPWEPPAGVKFTFSVFAEHELRIKPGPGYILMTSDCNIGERVYSSTVGDSITLVAVGNLYWVVTSIHGSWQQEP